MDDTLEGHALRRYWKGHYFRSLTDETIDAFLLRGTAAGYGRAAARRVAAGLRRRDCRPSGRRRRVQPARCDVRVVASARWSDAAEDHERMAAARRYAASLERFASGM